MPTLSACSGSLVSRLATTLPLPFRPPSSPSLAFGMPYAPFLKTRLDLRAMLSVVPKKLGSGWLGSDAAVLDVKSVARSEFVEFELDCDG